MTTHSKHYVHRLSAVAINLVKRWPKVFFEVRNTSTKVLAVNGSKKELKTRLYFRINPSVVLRPHPTPIIEFLTAVN